MRKIKPVKNFDFKDLTKQEMLDLINKELPINIKKLEPIINRIYEKYPVIEKADISLIVKTAFELFREYLIMGYIMTFQKFLFDIRLYFFQQIFNNQANTCLKVQLRESRISKEGLK